MIGNLSGRVVEGYPTPDYQVVLRDLIDDTGGQGDLYEAVVIDRRTKNIVVIGNGNRKVPAYNLVAKMFFERSSTIEMEQRFAILRDQSKHLRDEPSLRSLPLHMLRLDNRLGFLSERILGRDLAKIFNDEPDAWHQSSLKAKIKFARDLAQGVARLHAISIVHADISPENVMVDLQKHWLRIIDLDGCGYLNLDPAVRGHFYYKAPELEKGLIKPNKYTDLWSLAALIYDLLLTGARPFCHKIMATGVWPYPGHRKIFDLLGVRLESALVTFPVEGYSRPDAEQWFGILDEAWRWISPCEKCGASFVHAYRSACPNCSHPLSFPIITVNSIPKRINHDLGIVGTQVGLADTDEVLNIWTNGWTIYLYSDAWSWLLRRNGRVVGELHPEKKPAQILWSEASNCSLEPKNKIRATQPVKKKKFIQQFSGQFRRPRNW